ncbi:MAG: cytochrome c oxidase subunit 3, partial [Deltaproteobacteria bacterium]|nr:cytochrome c oxidase subunit 3 [Deltaproteobacteria bacterium]
LGLVFLAFKSYEYAHEIGAGYTPKRSLFWGFYFLMTGLHGLHIIGGLVANLLGYLAFRKGRDLQRSEPLGIYWHFVDVVWIYLFPLLYLAS